MKLIFTWGYFQNKKHQHETRIIHQLKDYDVMIMYDSCTYLSRYRTSCIQIYGYNFDYYQYDSNFLSL